MLLRNRRRRGSEAVEFALVFPVFITLIMGGVELMWFMSMVAALHTSVRVGARAGAVSATDNAVANAEAAALDAWNASGNRASTITFVASEVGASPNLQLQLVGTMGYVSLTGLLPPSMLPATVTRQVTMHLEDQVP